MDSNLLLTIVIPAYNSAHTLASCLDSIEGADWGTTEVLVIDDGSDDDLSSVVDQSSIAQHVRLIGQSRSGVSVARNLGVREARGAFILFMDADDSLVPGSLGPFLSDAVRADADICIGDFLLRSGDQTSSVSLNTTREDFDARDADVFQWLCLGRVGFGRKKNVGLLGAPWAKIYRRAFLEATFPDFCVFTPGVNRGEDVLANVEAFGKARSIRYHKRPTYVYNISSTSTTNRASSQYVENVRTLGERLDELAVREDWRHLAPAIAKVRVTLLEEGILRLGETRDKRSIRRIADDETFASGLRTARLRDFSLAGKAKLLLLRRRLYGLYNILLCGNQRARKEPRAGA